MKIYKIKANEDLFYRWMKLQTKTQLIVRGQDIVQNDMEMTAEQLNEWYKGLTADIESVRVDFKKTLEELDRLKAITIDYIKNGSENPFE
jgi:hypothetical protein